MGKVEVDYRNYSMRPLLISVEEAHHEGIVRYDESADDYGTVIFTHPTTNEERRIPKKRQQSNILRSFMSLNKALTHTANSPIMKGEESLRDQFDQEYDHYKTVARQTKANDGWAPEYGNYLFDQHEDRLYRILPEYWHRLGLVTSPSKLVTDPDGELSFQQIRDHFDNFVFGVGGASVGGNLLEGVAREMRPKRMKIADPDWLELTNLSRGERASIRYLAGSLDECIDSKDPYDTSVVNKAEFTAYEQHLIDPYAEIFVYAEGLQPDNIERFLKGDGNEEPGIDLFGEEMDDPYLKVFSREKCREHRIAVIMMTDFGHIVQMQFQDFKNDPILPLGYNIPDDELWRRVTNLQTSGKRTDFVSFLEGLCGDKYKDDEEFTKWLNGVGEQATSAPPQSGITAMASGAIGGETAARWSLNHSIPPRVTYNLKQAKAIAG